MGANDTVIIPGQEPLLAPGVRGYTVECDGELWIPVVFAEREGAGDVGRYLDTLPKDKTVIFPTVLSARLEGMLKRRGFALERVYCKELGQSIGWKRGASQ